MNINEEKQLKQYIKQLVREALFNEFNLTEKDKNDEKPENDGKGKEVKRVLAKLKSPGTNKAQFAYKLWPNKDKASARSYFYKKLDREKNDDGDTYNFTDKEYNELTNLTNDIQI